MKRYPPIVALSSNGAVPPDHGHAAVLENMEGHVLAAAGDRPGVSPLHTLRRRE